MDIPELLLSPESKTLEFKRDISSMGPIIKTVVAFANTAGGILVIGQESPGKFIGVNDVFKAEEALASAIADSIYPSMRPDIEIATMGDKNFLIIRVAYFKGPFYVKSEGFPRGVYIRIGSTSRPAGPELIAEMQRSLVNVSYDQQPVPDLSKSDLDLEIFSRNFKKKVDDSKLQTLGVLASVGNRLVPTLGGLILLGKLEARERWVPQARVACARFQGNNKAHFIDRMDIEGTILEAVLQVPKFIARNSQLHAEFTSIQRRDIPQYPPLAVREVLINALVHADYSIGAAPIQVAIFEDRLEIQSPGIFPFGYTLGDFKAGVSHMRNRVLTRVFRELHIMEQWGSGYKRIIEECQACGYPEPKWEELGPTLRVTFFPYVRMHFRERSATPQSHPFRGGLGGPELVNSLNPRRIPFIDEGVLQSPEALLDHEMALLNLFEEGKALAFRDIFKHVSPYYSERSVRYHLAALQNKGLLTSLGKGRAKVWKKSY
ncbi:MAG: putative DNA binding domain-containing protein [Verrucomicrobia bacterium]|nr:putative DNA binding domain-containing protein [Verrucomicrobiota bacterium]